MPNPGIQLYCVGKWLMAGFLACASANVLATVKLAAVALPLGLCSGQAALELDGFPGLNYSAGHHFHLSSL